MKRHNALLATAAAGLATLTACAATPVNPATLALTATAVTRINPAGGVTVQKTNVTWGGLPGNTQNVDLERSPSGSATRTKLGTFPASTTTFSDTNVAPGTTYTYYVTAFDQNNSPVGNASVANVKVFAASDIGAPTITAPAANAQVDRSQGFTATWQQASPVPTFYYVLVNNSQGDVFGLILSGGTTTANIGTIAPKLPAQSLVPDNASIPNLSNVIDIKTAGGFSPGTSYQLSVSAIISDNAADLAQAHSVGIRDSAPVTFAVS